MSGIRTNAAAELLGVSPNTLRSWERRFGYPKPRRTSGGHRQYDLTELEALRRALLETHNISSAIEVARQRGEGPTSAARLVEAFDRYDETLADSQRTATAVGHYGTPDDIAATVSHLAGVTGRFITGATILVDGGYAA